MQIRADKTSNLSDKNTKLTRLTLPIYSKCIRNVFKAMALTNVQKLCVCKYKIP